MDINNGLNDCLILTESMLQLAREGQWDVLHEMEIKRKKMLESCFEEPVAPGNVANVEHYLRTLLNLNNQITQLANEARSQVAGHLHRMGKGKTAASAYMVHS